MALTNDQIEHKYTKQRQIAQDVQEATEAEHEEDEEEQTTQRAEEEEKEGGGSPRSQPLSTTYMPHEVRTASPLPQRDELPLAVARPSLKFTLRRVQNINTITDFTQIMAEDVSALVESVFCAALLLLGANYLLKKVASRSGLPEVLLFLFSGMLLRFVSDPVDAAKFDIIAKPFVRMSLAAMGLQIGSHLNKAVLAPLLKPLLQFSVVFIPIVLFVSSGVATMLFPSSLSPYAWLVGSVALERSSPEALHGIATAKAAGPFTNATMAIAALQDIYALVAFVIFSALVGSPLLEAALHLVELAVGTAVATAVMVLAVRALSFVPSLSALFGQAAFANVATNTSATNTNNTSNIPTVGPSTSAGGGLNEVSDGGDSPQQPSTPTIKQEPAAAKARRLQWLRLLVAALVFIIPFLSWFFHVELLLAAVVSGSILNWESPHPMTSVLDSQSNAINIALFCLLGHRISVVSYLQNVPAALILFVARLVGLWLGAMGGGFAGRLHVSGALLGSPNPQNAPLFSTAAGGVGQTSPPPQQQSLGAVGRGSIFSDLHVRDPSSGSAWHNYYRWMGLVTQLGIALSLVDRMEEQFPVAAPMARACGGSVIGGLLVGPSLLQYVLRRVGESGKANQSSGGAHQHGGGGAARGVESV